jgi:hypothetical protein
MKRTAPRGLRRSAALCAAFLLACAVFVAFFLVPGIVATRPEPLGGAGALAMGSFFLFWIYVLLLIVDAVAAIYGLRRPFLFVHTPKTWVGLGNPTVQTRLDLLLTCLFSYGFTLYGFAVVYALISRDAGAFSAERLDLVTALYFSVVTGATVGYGDIVPQSPLAKAVVMMEIASSFLYAVFIFSVVAGLLRRGDPG